MNLYLLSLINDDSRGGYDKYDSCVVAAMTEMAARKIHPDGSLADFPQRNWASSIENVKAELIGKAIEGTKSDSICASFNDGG